MKGVAWKKAKVGNGKTEVTSRESWAHPSARRSRAPAVEITRKRSGITAGGRPYKAERTTIETGPSFARTKTKFSKTKVALVPHQGASPAKKVHVEKVKNSTIGVKKMRVESLGPHDVPKRTTVKKGPTKPLKK